MWVEDVENDGTPSWTLTTTTNDHTYVRAGAPRPYQYGKERNYVQVRRPLESFLETQPALIAKGIQL